MAQASHPKPPRHLPGANLTWGETLRLVGLLCVIPWLFTAALFVFGVVPLPQDAVGWIIAAKSLARFKQLEDREFAEYFLVGTLASFLLAVLVGQGVRILLRLG